MSTNNICYSGGADGADKAWGEAALQAGHQLIHYCFKNHKGSKGPNAVILEKDQLVKADPYLVIANQSLKRSWPAHSEFVSNLLRRNYWQVCDTDALYAVAGIDRHTVFGGTAWAVEMFKQLYPSSERLYVFDTNSGGWHQWMGYGWSTVAREDVPTPSGKWTGIGSRELGVSGQKAIEDLFHG